MTGKIACLNGVDTQSLYWYDSFEIHGHSSGETNWKYQIRHQNLSLETLLIFSPVLCKVSLPFLSFGSPIEPTASPVPHHLAKIKCDQSGCKDFSTGFPACNANTRNKYLSDAYLATCILESALFLIIQCEVVLAAEEKPFLVADCVAIWLHQDDPLPNDLGFYGESSIRKTSGQPSDLLPFQAI